MKIQKGNGSIGDRATGVIARMIMNWWAKLLKIKLHELEIELHMIEIFVDDINIVVDETPLGAKIVDILRKTDPFASNCSENGLNLS